MKKGLTLVELLTVIAILGLLIMLLVPNLLKMLENNKERLYEDQTSELTRLSRNYIIDNPSLYKDIDEDGYLYVGVETLCEGEYINCPIKDPRDDSNIEGCIKIEKVEKDYEYTYEEECNSSDKVYVTVELNGGTLSNNIEGEYDSNSEIDLPTPTKDEIEFNGWIIIKGNGKINGNKLKLNYSDITLYAGWKRSTKLIVDKNGGTSSQVLKNNYNTGTVIELEDLEKRGYTFTGWELVSGDSILSGKTLTIGLEDTNIKGMFDLASYTCAAGTYLKKGEISCTTCEAGSYCPGGTYIYNEKIDQGINGCPGRINSPAGSSLVTQCKVTCPAGEYLKKNETSCSTCEANSYCEGGSYNYNENINQGINGCPGSMTSGAGSTSKTACKITCSGGTYLAKSGSACSNCTAGNYCAGGTYNYSDSGNQGISQCGANKYSGAKAAACTSCPSGFSSSAGSTSATSCKKTCAAGTYLQANSATCATCTAGNYCTGGTWSKSTSNQGLTSCGTGKTSTAGAKTASNCYAITQTFDYTGGIQTFKAPVAGKYKLEVWGAQGGGCNNNIGGFGGYAVGVANLSANQILYVVVGGAGGKYAGGYNGGGNGFFKSDQWAYGGGGATHIAKQSGVLSSLSGSIGNILIVAGGGGGNGGHDCNAIGGSAGGYIGNSGYDTVNPAISGLNSNSIGTGGTSSSAGYMLGYGWQDKTCGLGSFGIGGHYCDEGYGAAGGGGGYYGGGGSNRGHAGGGGGSGYIGNGLLISSGNVTKHMTGYNVTTSTDTSTKTNSTTNANATATADQAKKGNGYAKITFVSS